MKFLLSAKFRLHLFLVFTSFVSVAANVNTDFLQMRGTLVSHPFDDKTDSLSVKKIIELRSDNGLSIWFGRDIKKVVCLTGVCRLAHIWLFWDGLGDYLGFQLFENDPLTKTEHVDFSEADYLKLDRILADSLSVLRSIKEENLTYDDKKGELVDGHTGATQAMYRDDLVTDAAFTCYTLWHTVYGATRDEIKKMINLRVDSAYLHLMLTSDNSAYQKWAIQYIAQKPKYNRAFGSYIFSLIASKDHEISVQALNYLSSGFLASPVIQQKLFELFDSSSLKRKYQIMYRLSGLTYLDDKIILYFLNEFDRQKISASMLNYIYKSIVDKNLKNTEIRRILIKFTRNRNTYVRSITQRLLFEAKK